MADSLAARLRADGYAVRLMLENPRALAADALDGPARAAVIIGGDGTLRAVADRLQQHGNAPPLLTVPLGTANLMARHLGIRWHVARFEAEVSTAIARRRLRRLDVGRVNGEVFLLMTGIGFDAHVVHELARVRRGPIRYSSYLLPAALAVGGYRFAPLRIIADGREVFSPARPSRLWAMSRNTAPGSPCCPALGRTTACSMCASFPAPRAWTWPAGSCWPPPRSMLAPSAPCIFRPATCWWNRRKRCRCRWMGIPQGTRRWNWTCSRQNWSSSYRKRAEAIGSARRSPRGGLLQQPP